MQSFQYGWYLNIELRNTDMNNFTESLRPIKRIVISGTHTVESTAAEALRAVCGAAVVNAGRMWSDGSDRSDTVRLMIADDPDSWIDLDPKLHGLKQWQFVRMHGSCIDLAVSHPHLLYNLVLHLLDDAGELDGQEMRDGVIFTPAFERIRPVYDLFLNQHARTVQGFDREEHVRNLARLGCTHVEVNGLAFPLPFEQGPAGEVLHRFYTYCPSLDQFVSSALNKGVYDSDYLQANLNLLKTNAGLADKYGLTPGLVCFEPRSVPDALLEKYPMLRGARVDHPIRSFRPRYNLSIGHPVVRAHYAELLTKVMNAAPKIDYLSIWSNDSGAGFEYTHSLYVGRNGGGYIIREWKDAGEIAEAAANSIAQFLKLLRDAGRAVNPSFRVLLRMEAFWTEQEYLWKHLEDGIDVEVSSLLSKGWGLKYKHPKYPEVREIHGTALYNRFAPEEKQQLAILRNKGSDADIYFSPGTIWNHEPLLGIPFPKLVYEKLRDLREQDVATICWNGGPTPQSFAPYNINDEVVRAFQFDRNLNLEDFLKRTAVHWIGAALATDLVEVWRLSEEAYRSFPIPVWLFSSWGVWYRNLIRPLIPDIEAVRESDRAYYEDFLLSTAHNKARVDLRYDVGFDLCDPAHAEHCVELMDRDLFQYIDAALSLLSDMSDRSDTAMTEIERACIIDLRDRLAAMRCWYRNQRNCAVWIAGVHGYLETDDPAKRARCRAMLHDMVLDEIENTKKLLTLWETSGTRWMIVSDAGETTFIYYKNFGDHLKRKLALMPGHEDDEPRVDPGFQWRLNW
jgi:hypothetical protein